MSPTLRPRADRPELWGPLTRNDLLRWLATEYKQGCSKAARTGFHPSPAALIAWEQLRKQLDQGYWRPSHLPPNAAAMVRHVQLQPWHQ